MRASIATSVAICAAFAASAPPAGAEDVKAASKVDAVTVYPQGAEVTRIAKTRIAAGEHTVILSDLPAGALPASIRVEGRATGGRLEIGSVDSRRLAVPRDDAAALASERKRIENEIEKLRDDKAILAAAVQAAEAQKQLIANLVQLPIRPPASTGTAVAQPDWGQLLGLIDDRMEKAQHRIVDLGIKSREIDRSIDDLAKKLASLAPAPLDRTEVKVFVTAAAAIEAEILVRYQIGAASWTPLYDARLATGSRTAPPKLQLIRRAMVQQRTGETWDAVALSLSTARPAAATAAPELTMLAVDFQSDRPMPAAAPPASRSMSAPQVGGVGGGADGRLRYEAEAKQKADVDALQEQQAQEIRTEVTAQAFQTIYGVAGRVTIPETGEAKRLLIGQDDLDPQLLVRTVPRYDQTAYLYAKLALPKTLSPIAQGQVALFRDGVFVGNGRVPQLAAGETHELGFGADDMVKVKRITLEDKKGESGVFTTSQVEARDYQITVKNLRAQPLQVSVLDRIPVAMHQDIKVDPTFAPVPTRKDVLGRRGTVAWDFQIAPDEEKMLALGYRVTAPAGRRISYGEKTDDMLFQGARIKF